MRTLAFATLAVIPVLTLGACASSGMGHSTALSPRGDMARLQKECDARHGMLLPTGKMTNEPALDNYCKITGADPTPPRS